MSLSNTPNQRETCQVSENPKMGTARVVAKFMVASLFMWLLPQLVLQAFRRDLLPGISGLSPQSRTLWSGCLAVLSVNIVIVIYVVLALQEPPVASTPSPDPAFASKARSSLVPTDEAAKKDE